MPQTEGPALAFVNATTPTTRRAGAAAAGARAASALAQLFRFAWVQVQCCLFAVAVFVGLAVSSVLPLPIPRYDALLAYAVVLTAIFFLLRLETGREVAVIFTFHLVGLALEVFKVRVGSWSYPESAWTKVGGVPLYSGFMYAAVGSYICQAFRRLDLRVDRFPWPAAVALAAAAYANFFTHHYLPDLRWVIAAGFVLVLWRSWVFYTVGRRRYAMPLSLSFVLIGFFLWVAENAATLLGAWQYPDQEQVWQMVHVGKWGSWALLVSLSFVLVAAVKMQEGRFYGEVGAVATVTRSVLERPYRLVLIGDGKEDLGSLVGLIASDHVPGATRRAVRRAGTTCWPSTGPDRARSSWTSRYRSGPTGRPWPPRSSTTR